MRVTGRTCVPHPHPLASDFPSAPLGARPRPRPITADTPQTSVSPAYIVSFLRINLLGGVVFVDVFFLHHIYIEMNVTI